MVSREQLHKEIGNAHQDLLNISQTLEHMAKYIRYLHPHMADDLTDIAHDMEKARKTIQGNHAQLINIDLQASHNHIGEVFKALLEPTS